MKGREKNYGVLFGSNICDLHTPKLRINFVDKFIWVRSEGEEKMLKLPLSDVLKCLQDKLFHTEMKRKYKHLKLVEGDDGK